MQTTQNTAGEETSRDRRPGPLLPVLAVPVLVAVMLTLFAWPASKLGPHQLPLGVAGPEQATQLIGQGLAEAGEDAFEIHRYGDEAEARAAIEEREVYGAIVAGPSGLTVLTASAASPAVAQFLQAAGTEMAAAAPAPGQDTGTAPRVVDVVPTDPDDPRGAVLGASFFPLLLAGLATGVLAWLTGRAGFGQALVLLLVAGLAGLVVTGIAQGWLGAFGGDWWVNASVLGLTVLAIAASVAGLGTVFGRAGIGVGAVLMMLVGNPFSGVTSAPELLPVWAGVTGQYLPPGAGGTLLRSTAYFDGAGAATPLLVLGCWAGAGLLLAVLGRWIGRAPSRPA